MLDKMCVGIAVVGVSALASGEVIDFSTMSSGDPIQGVTIGNATFSTSVLDGVFAGDPYVALDPTSYNHIQGEYLLGAVAPGNWLAVDFASPVNDLGFGFATPTAFPEDLYAMVTVYGAGNAELGSETFLASTHVDDTNGSNAFVLEGWADMSSYTGVTRMEVSFDWELPFSQTYKFDSLTFTPVPAPAGALLIPGAMLFGTRRRR